MIGRRYRLLTLFFFWRLRRSTAVFGRCWEEREEVAVGALRTPLLLPAVDGLVRSSGGGGGDDDDGDGDGLVRMGSNILLRWCRE